jgi:hypothetical protein
MSGLGRVLFTKSAMQKEEGRGIEKDRTVKFLLYTRTYTPEALAIFVPEHSGAHA